MAEQNGTGTPAGDGANGGGDAPKSVTLEQVNELVNKALGARDKRFEAKVTEMFGNFGKSLDERLSALTPKPPEEQAPGDKKVDPELLKLRQEQAALNKRLEASEKARADAETKSRAQRAENELQAALTKAGVRPEAMGRLLKSFRAEVSFDEAGNPMLPVDDGTTSIDAAIATWAKSDEAKAFLPAPNAGGSGTPRAQNAPRTTRDLTNIPPAQWTDAERQAKFEENQRMLAEKRAKDPFAFG